MNRLCMQAIVLLVIVTVRESSAREPVPLHTAIDVFVDNSGGAIAAGTASDSEFLRRVTLDLAGRIPNVDAARQFLADPAADKRVLLVDRLLASPEFPQRLADALDVMLMERRGEDAAWRAWLVKSISENKPWNQLVHELLDPDASSETTRAAAYFMTKRLEKYGQNPTDFPGLTRDIGRMFLGFDLQCAECHDHLFIPEYKQVDFQGLYSVYRNTFVRRDVKFPAIGEKLMTEPLEFVSVFDPTKKATGPRIPLGRDFRIPEGLTPPKNPKEAPPRPEFSAVSLIARELTQSGNRQFARNAVNRFWFLLLGRGIVHPLDVHHADNPPSHPKLLEKLTEEFIAHEFDLKWLIREITLSKTYQRSSQWNGEDIPSESTFLVAIEKRLSAEQLADSLLVAMGELNRFSTEAQQSSEDAASSEKKVSEDAEQPLTREAIRAAFKSAFANAAREPEDTVSSTVKGALFWRNSEPVQQLLRRRPGNLIDRLVNHQQSSGMVEDLYLSVLSRTPSPEERATIDEFVAGYGDERELAIRDAVWALLTSVEFYVNH